MSRRTSAALALLCGLAACANNPNLSPTPQPVPSAAPADSALHNIHKVNDNLISGAVPDSPAAFDELVRLGVKTIISVDGAAPDVAAAESRGLRYIHIPVTYATIAEPQRLQIAKAIKDLPGPVYIHCHHGKHRGPAATAAAAIALGIMTPDEGLAFMKSAGTAPNYTGLYACIAAATVASAAALDETPDDFPSIHRAQGIVAAMIEIDEAFDHLGAIKAAAWSVPTDHPDLVPAAEAGHLHDNLRLSAQDHHAAKTHGQDFSHLLLAAIDRASTLEELILAGAPPADLDAAYNGVQASCKACHAKYRDVN